MTTNDTPISDVHELSAAIKRGDEIYFNGCRMDNINPGIAADGSIRFGLYTARPRAPKEFDFWTAMRDVAEGRASKAVAVGHRDTVMLNVQCVRLVFHSGASVWLEEANYRSKWHLYDLDGKEVTE